jgi:hypothetical protein
MPSHRKLGVRPFRTQTDSGNESRKQKNPFVTYPKESRFHLEIRLAENQLLRGLVERRLDELFRGSKIGKASSQMCAQTRVRRIHEHRREAMSELKAGVLRLPR